MANKKYNEFAADTNPQLTDILLIADPATGALTKVTLAQLQTLIGGSAGTLATPTGLTVTAGNTQLVLDWADVANATGYTIQRATDAGFTANLATVTSATSNATLTGLTNGILYYVRVKATAAGYTDSAYTAASSGTPSGTPQLATPTGFTATAGNTQVSLSWNTVANATSYTLQDSTDGVNFFTSYEGATPSAVVTGLTNGTLYYFRVKATAAGYTDSAWASAQQTPASSYDSDAQAFFTAAGITNTAQKDAVDDLVVAMKAASIWAKMDAIYPFVGGTANTHKFNLKNPLDTNAAHRITWAGTLTHNANGVTGDGASGYGNTNYNPSTHGMTDASAHFSVYVRSAVENNPSGEPVLGAKYSNTSEMILMPDLSNLTYGSLFNPSNYVTQNPTTGRTGLFTMSRQSTSLAKLWRNGTLLGSATGATASPPDSVVFLLNQADFSINLNTYSTANIAFVSFGEGLTDADELALRNAVIAFQTALGRNV